MTKDIDINTKLVHAGHVPDKETLSRAVPLYSTTSYVFWSTRHADDLIDDIKQALERK
ncbi:MAG: hypothetical protein KKF44_00220 [Nanoarchaeota archaeon]|nr:hypothetical protein [Nanoarchaeota archaeon]